MTTFAQVPLAHIVTSRTNPRKWFDPAKLAELAESIKAEVEAEHRAEIAARKAAKAFLPLPPAAQAERGAGDGSKPKGKGKKAPAAPAVPKVSAEEAMQGIAAAMQNSEAGGDCAPGGVDPAGGVAAGEPDGRATSPDAGASETGPGASALLQKGVTA